MRPPPTNGNKLWMFFLSFVALCIAAWMIAYLWPRFIDSMKVLYLIPVLLK